MEVSNQTPAEGTTDEFSNHDLIIIEGTGANVRQFLVDLDFSVSGPSHDLAACFFHVKDVEDGAPIVGIIIQKGSDNPSGSLCYGVWQVLSIIYPNVSIVVIRATGITEFRAGKSVAQD